MKELDISEMKKLIVDYSFGRLSKNESIIFESNLSRYPDLKDEIIEIRNAFSKVNKEELSSNLEKRTSNFIYKVKQKQLNSVTNRNLKKNILKLALPIIAVVSFFMFMRQIELGDKDTISSLPEFILTSSEADIIFGESEIAYYNPYFNDFYSEPNAKGSEIVVEAENSSNLIIYNYLNEISESEFNELLDNLDNETFNM